MIIIIKMIMIDDYDNMKMILIMIIMQKMMTRMIIILYNDNIL